MATNTNFVFNNTAKKILVLTLRTQLKCSKMCQNLKQAKIMPSKNDKNSP